MSTFGYCTVVIRAMINGEKGENEKEDEFNVVRLIAYVHGNREEGFRYVKIRVI